MFKRFLISALICSSVVSVSLADPVEYPDREFYGFFLGNGAWTNAKNSQYGFGRQTFAAPASNTLLHELTDNIGVFAACAVDGVYYAIPYAFSSSLTAPIPMPMFSYNVYTGYVEQIGDWNVGQDANFKPQDMTYDLKNDRILAIGYDPVNLSSIYEVDRTTGKFTLLVKLATTAGTISCDAYGRVFVINTQGQLCQVDLDNDYRQEVLFKLPYEEMQTNQTAEFDLTCNKLYWASNCRVTPSPVGMLDTNLIEITLPVIGTEENYKATSGTYSYNEVGPIGVTSRFLGMYIPYCEGGFGAPGFATDIKPVSAPDGSSLTLNFKTPEKTFGNDKATNVDGFEIYREGKLIATVKEGVTAGKECTFTDSEVPASGTYRYDILCYSNTGGNGPKTPVYAYVGYDRPAAVTEIDINILDGWKDIDLSWEAPQTGAQGGTYDVSETRYDVVRLPDNVTVAENLAEPKVTDTNIRRMLRYSYKITSKNSIGSSTAVSKEFVAGPPVEDLPLEETFENPTVMKNRWMTYDNNNDTYTWLFGADIGHSVFGDYEMAAEYIVSPTLSPANMADADEWIVSPPVKFPASGEYVMVIGIRSVTNEAFNVYVGSRNVPSLMTKVDSFTLREPEFTDDSAGAHMIFQNYVVPLPADIAGSISCVGLQLATPAPADLSSYVQIGSIAIGDSSLAVSTIDKEDGNVNITVLSDTVFINGAYRHAALYNINGVKVADVTGNSCSLALLPSGVYILNVDGKSVKIAH